MNVPSVTAVLVLAALSGPRAMDQTGPSLAGSSWQLLKFNGGDDSTLTPEAPSKYTVQFDAGGEVSVRFDCNRGRGSWKSAGPGQLEFGPLALTRAMCPPGSLHDHLARQWGFVRSYMIRDGHLFLSLMADGGIYEFEPLRAAPAAQAAPDPRQPRGAAVSLYAPEQHALYDGHFILSASRIYMVGGVADPPGWDHMDNAAATVKPVEGTAAIDVDEIRNTGTFEVRLTIPEGDLVLAVDRWHEFSPCQNGGIAAYLMEHGTDSGCGDANWPKTFVFLAGWGYGHATLNGKPLFQDYEMHFMVTQGIRDRKTLKVSEPMAGRTGLAGAVNPATQQIDFYIRSPQQNARNHPNRDVFMHFFGMEVTWK